MDLKLAVYQKNMRQKRNHKSKSRFHMKKGRVVYIILLQLFLIAIFSVILIYHGPFGKLKDAIVVQAMNTHQQTYWATWFLSEKEIEGIMIKANPVVMTASENLNEIKITAAAATNNSGANHGVIIKDISDNGFKGKIMIISDPSRVTVGIAPDLGHSGDRLSQIISAYGAVGGVNAGGFLDDNFIQNGALPSGIVIVNGKIISQQKGLKTFNVIGFNNNNNLVVANSMSLEQIKNSKLRCAVSFGPALIVNGQSMIAAGGSALEPRTLIGQRIDGTILLMTIDGRQSASVGATYTTAVNEMLKYGAYNAANLDGGSSTAMYWHGRIINSPCDLLGERSIPTAIIVMP